jgi:hypothetical protein
MGPRSLPWLSRIAFVTCAALASGCDSGGLLVVEHKPETTVQGPSVNELVSNGTYAKNGKYRIFYTMGQPSPNTDVATSGKSTVHGGLVGAAHSD